MLIPPEKSIDAQCHHQYIGNIGIYGTPPRRHHYDRQGGALIIPFAVIVGGLHPEHIFTGSQLRIGSTLSRRRYPSVIDPFEPIAELIGRGRNIIECHKIQRDIFLVVTQNHLGGKLQGRREQRIGSAYNDAPVVYLHPRNIDRRYMVVNTKLIGIKGYQPFDCAEIECPVAAFEGRFVIELVRQQTITLGINPYRTSLGIEAYQSLVGAKPKVVMPIFQYLVTYIIGKAVFNRECRKIVGRTVIAAYPPSVGREPPLTLPPDGNADH